MSKDALAAIRTQVMWNRLIAVVEEQAQSLLRTAAQAHCTSVVLSQGAPLRRRLDRRLPALSSLRGHMPAHEMRCAADGNRLMSIPISETMT